MGDDVADEHLDTIIKNDACVERSQQDSTLIQELEQMTAVDINSLCSHAYNETECSIKWCSVHCCIPFLMWSLCETLLGATQ